MREEAATQVVLYTDQSFLAEGLSSVLCSGQEFRLAASYSALPDALSFLAVQGADILLLDLTDEINISALHSIRHVAPRCRTALWVSTVTTELAYQAMEAGVRGILRKSTPPDRFIAALEAIHRGDLWFEKELLESILCGKRVVLTVREGQLVNLLSQGLKNKEIAWTLQITEGTVKVYLSRLFKKLDVNDRFELALYGLRNMQSKYANPSEHSSPVSRDRTRANLLPLRSILIDERESRSPMNPSPLQGLARRN